MIVRHWSEVPAETVGEGARNTTIRWLIADKDGAPNFYMRMLEIGPDGATPDHAHPWEHEVYIVGGTGELVIDGGAHPLKVGDTALVPPGLQHFFRSTGSAPMHMLCLIPAQPEQGE